ncbi:O-antigen ligase family protein [Photobacterium damselae]|uniref:O-antigen ligase family protein n=1 Tax=Photobacterium damselae TaxID=38293 RepID=UPI0018A43505|nr:O-antigen ligase family protein [Photobacterium damselae]QOQ69295.1 O-antigen ligase family protein [Photobacterium damselae subsp. damselae]
MGKEDRKLNFKYLAYFLIFFLFIALLFKLKNGLFNRDVKFIMLGPIVFGRLMGIGLLLSIFSIDSKYKNIIALSFLFGVLLSFSKGPILSLSLVFLLYLFLNKKIKSLLFLSVFIFLIYLNINSVINYFISFDIPSLSRILNVIYVLVNGGDVTNGSNYGSIGSRSDMYKATINLIQLHPLGVGVGLWSNYISIEGLKYPHNLFLEVFSELGVFLGVLFLIPFLLFLLVRKNNQMLFLICMFLLFNQMVSGSIADARYLLFFSVVSAFLCWNDRGTNKGINKG